MRKGSTALATIEVRGMRLLWLHRHSIVSFGLSVANVFVSFVAMSTWYWGAPFNYRSGLQGGLAWFPLVLGLISIGFGGIALGKEHPKGYAFAALGASVPIYFLSLLRHAV
jgi:hypothetical protein